jgi:hypothetical protein
MLGLLEIVIALAPAQVLLVSGAVHIMARDDLARSLRRQRVLPSALHRSLSVLLPGLELALGGATAAALFARDLTAFTLASAAVGGLYLFYSAYTFFLLRNRPSVPCGCLGSQEPVTGAVVGRAALLSALALVSVVVANVIDRFDYQFLDLALAACVAAVFTSLASTVPTALETRVASTWGETQ